MIKRIHVNQHIIRDNAHYKRANPPLSIKRGGKTERAMEVEIEGPCTIVYRPGKPLSCGARVWIETTSEIVLK